MTLPENVRKQLDDPRLSTNERALLRSNIAADFLTAGQLDEARDALGDLWNGIAERPAIEKLKKATAALVLLRSGAVSSAIAAEQKLSEVQVLSLDLIRESIRLFETHKQVVHLAEAQRELAIAHWRLGSDHDARKMLSEALRTVGDRDDELKAKILLDRAVVETSASEFEDALEILTGAEELFRTLPANLNGKRRAHLGLVFYKLGLVENRADYLDRALGEFESALELSAQCRNRRCGALILKDYALLLCHIGRTREAHENLDLAVERLTTTEDALFIARIDSARARIMIAEHKFSHALGVIEKVLPTFEETHEYSRLSRALALKATALSRLGDHSHSLRTFQLAIDIASDVGAGAHAGRASLAMIEEHGATRLSELEVYAAYKRSDEQLKDSRDLRDVERLRTSARIVMRRLVGTQISDPDFSLNNTLHKYEARFIEAALSKTGGRVSHAAKMLGLSHQTLSTILKNRHRDLQHKRTPMFPRRRGIARKYKKVRQPKSKTLSLLYVEDNRIVIDAVKESLEREGFSVTVLLDGRAALDLLQSRRTFHLLLFDFEIEGLDGIELVRATRKIAHRRRLPIIVFSDRDVASEAYRAGADLFLQKPDEMLRLSMTIKRMLSERG